MNHRSQVEFFQSRLAPREENPPSPGCARECPAARRCDAFFDVRDRQPARAFGFERARDFHRAVTVGVGFHHRHHFDWSRRPRPHRAIVRANLRPAKLRPNFSCTSTCSCTSQPCQQFLIRIRHGVPTVARRARVPWPALAKLRARSRASRALARSTCARVRRCERQARAAGDFGVLRRVEIQRQRAAAHGLDQRRMRAADLGRVDVGEAVRAQLAIALRHRSRPGSRRADRWCRARARCSPPRRERRRSAPASDPSATCSNASRTSSALFSGSMRLTYRKYLRALEAQLVPTRRTSRPRPVPRRKESSPTSR